jgi:HAE1 family hydrophobic/amphiphilic exporter-1
MTVTSPKLVLSCAAVMAAITLSGTPAAAQQRTSELRVQELIRDAARIAASGQTATPTTAQQGGQTTAPAAGPKVALTLDDAVKLALDRNLDIAVQRLNPEISDLAVATAQAVYLPSLTSTLLTQGQTTASTNSIAGGTAAQAVTNDGTNWNGGLTQNLRKGGGFYSVSLNNTRATSSSTVSLYNPSYTPLWTAQYTQPLLRGFRIDSTRQQLKVSKINRDISDVQLMSTITNTLSNVRNAYWDYVFAVQSVEVAQQTLSLANKQVEDNQTRVQVGTMAPIDVVQARAQAASALQNLVVAQATMRTSELALKRMIVNGTQDPNWNATIDPVDRPDFRPEQIDVDGAIRRALSQRTDLQIAQKNVQANDITLQYLDDQTKPQADFVGNYGLSGIGGTQLIRQSSGVGVSTNPITSTIPGGYGDALASIFRTDYPRWTAQVNISYPLGVSAQKAAVARARVQLNQVQAQLKQIELQVATEITNQAITIRSNIERVQAAQAARDLAEQQLKAENDKFAVGMSTNYFVINAQNQLATMQNNELQAILNYRKSLVDFDRLQQTTLQNLNITVVGR